MMVKRFTSSSTFAPEEAKDFMKSITKSSFMMLTQKFFLVLVGIVVFKEFLTSFQVGVIE